MIGIDEVASRAGVSKSTVSRAFSRPDSVRVETRSRVLALAEELGYTPNPVARSLAGGRSDVIGLFVPDIANPFFPPMIKAVQQQARRHGLSVLIADSDEHAEDEFAIVMDMARHVDGVILASPRMPDDQISTVLQSVSGVLINRDHPGDFARILSSTDGLTQAVEHLSALGHRRIAYLGGPVRAYTNAIRLEAVRDAVDRLGIRLVELGPFQPTFESGMRAADLVMASDVTAAVAYNDLIALGLMAQLKNRQTRIGTDLSVIGIDDTWLTPMITPALTSVHIPGAAAGAVAVRTLVEVIKDGHPPSNSPVVLTSELMVRATSGPPRVVESVA